MRRSDLSGPLAFLVIGSLLRVAWPADMEWKHEIVKKLSVMHDKEATDYLIEILNK